MPRSLLGGVSTLDCMLGLVSIWIGAWGEINWCGMPVLSGRTETSTGVTGVMPFTVLIKHNDRRITNFIGDQIAVCVAWMVEFCWDCSQTSSMTRLLCGVLWVNGCSTSTARCEDH